MVRFEFDYPPHIVQRGIYREPCFFAEEYYQCYLHWLEEAARDCRPTTSRYRELRRLNNRDLDSDNGGSNDAKRKAKCV